ncbi:MAG: SpoIIIAH-like family protein [Lachnospiraceae bacterium]|jgi:stage III sporulation protein AH|nr:SpoIIIAH-like family protein [Lachnospiraceae bacterium]
MKVLKRNQLIILVISLVLVTAGYLSFTSKYNEDLQTSAGIIARADSDETIGNAELVNSKPVTEGDASGVSTEEPSNETEAVNAEEPADYYFENSKLERDKMYSQMIENYTNMYENTSIPTEQKAIAANEITKINNLKNAIMISENLILTKGFENVVIFVNDQQISVVVKAEELLPEQIAQIQNIISREMKAEIGNIHISNK